LTAKESSTFKQIDSPLPATIPGHILELLAGSRRVFMESPGPSGYINGIIYTMLFPGAGVSFLGLVYSVPPRKKIESVIKMELSLLLILKILIIY